MCECLFRQCASGPVFTTSECASASLVCKSQLGQCASGPVCTTQECAGTSLVNVRVVR